MRRAVPGAAEVVEYSALPPGEMALGGATWRAVRTGPVEAHRG